MELLPNILIICGLLGTIAYTYINRWKKYDPTWLVELAKKEKPDDKWLHQALSKCTRIKGGHFVNPKRPNMKGSEWQYETNIILEDPEYGEIIIDILKDGRVGGIEYLGLMLKNNK